MLLGHGRYYSEMARRKRPAPQRIPTGTKNRFAKIFYFTLDSRYDQELIDFLESLNHTKRGYFIKSVFYALAYLVKNGASIPNDVLKEVPTPDEEDSDLEVFKNFLKETSIIKENDGGEE